MLQCIFDDFIHFVLQTISSEDYLNSIGIYRYPGTINIKWLKEKLENQSIIPGIYAIQCGTGSCVHYVGVRRENDRLVAGNGYPNNLGLPAKYSFGLNAQRDRSHGLCQTFALMFYLGKENLIQPGLFFINTLIGLKFLLEFIKKDPGRDRLWSAVTLKNNMETHCYTPHIKEKDVVIKSVRTGKGKPISMKKIFEKIILNPKNYDLLKSWYGLK